MSASHHHGKKKPIDHVIEKRTQGILSSSEVHGTEIPGSISAGTDAARETVILLLLLNLFFLHFKIRPIQAMTMYLLISFGWLIWKCGRSAWLGWSRLERLHRILEEERWEIEHNRDQEREELKTLYAAKGFEGKLLEDVLDVLMADGDRLLKVMVGEELGLSLEVHEHPLKQALGAAIGVLISIATCLSFFYLWPPGGLYLSAIAVLGFSGYLSAHYEGNRFTSAIVWNLAIAFLSIGSTKFLIDFIVQLGWLQ